MIEAFTQCVKSIASKRACFEETDLFSCDERTQKLYRKVVQAVKKTFGREQIAFLPEDDSLYIQLALKPTQQLIERLDRELPGAVESLIVITRVPLEEIKTATKERLSDLHRDLAELEILRELTEEQRERKKLLKKTIIELYEK